MKYLKKILYLLLPPIFYLENLKKIKNFILIRNKTNPYIKFEKAHFKRHAFINKAVSKFSNCIYLEIGVADNDVFNSIALPISQKYGVDPFSGGNYRMTSDDFFRKNPSLKFDVIFIDGLHHYLTCQQDVINSINASKEGAIILIDDMLPKNLMEEKTPQQQSRWTGDVWKVGVELFKNKHADFKIINIDSGIGVLKVSKKFEYITIPELCNKKFDDYIEYSKKFDLISSEEALKYIAS